MKETTPRPSGAPTAGVAQEQLTASVQALTLPKGLYTFSVRSADPERVAELGGLMLPALHVGLGPSVPADGIEFLSGREDGATWLYAAGDMLVAKIIDRPVTLFLTSVRAAGAQPLDVEIDRLDARSERRAAAEVVAEGKPEPQAEPAGQAEEGVRLQISAHISNRGDVVFIDTDWIGRLGNGMSIEAFSVIPLDRLGASDIEYKGADRRRLRKPVAQQWRAMRHPRHGHPAGRVCGAAEARRRDARLRLRLPRLLSLRRGQRAGKQRRGVPVGGGG